MSNYVIVAYLFGFILGIVTALVIVYHKIHATLLIDTTSDERKDMYKFVVHVPIDDIPKKKYLIVKVKQKSLKKIHQEDYEEVDE